MKSVTDARNMRTFRRNRHVLMSGRKENCVSSVVGVRIEPHSGVVEEYSEAPISECCEIGIGETRRTSTRLSRRQKRDVPSQARGGRVSCFAGMGESFVVEGSGYRQSRNSRDVWPSG